MIIVTGISCNMDKTDEKKDVRDWNIDIDLISVSIFGQAIKIIWSRV